MAVVREKIERLKRQDNDTEAPYIAWRSTTSNWTITTYQHQDPNSGQILSIRGNIGREVALTALQRYIGDHTTGVFNFSVCDGLNPLDAVHPDQLDFSRNCSISAQYVLGFHDFSSHDDARFRGEFQDLSISFWREALPPEWRHVPDCHVNNYYLKSQYFLWGLPSGDFLSDLVGGVQDDCLQDVCQKLGFSGNPDIAGIAAITGYIFTVAGTTIYLLAFRKRLFRTSLRIHDPTLTGSRSPSGWWERNRKALNNTASSFLGGCTLFCYLAWMGMIGQSIQGGATLYDKSVAYAVALFSINPSTCMFALLYDYDGSVGPITMIAVLFQFYILCFVGVPAMFDFSHTKVQWYPDHFCYEGYAMGAYPTTVAAILALGYLPPLLVVLSPLVAWLRGQGLTLRQRNIPSMSPRTREILRTFTVCYTWALTCVDLGLILNMRRAEKRISGETYAENTWGYGQYTAVLGTLFLVLQYVVEVIKPDETLPPSSSSSSSSTSFTPAATQPQSSNISITTLIHPRPAVASNNPPPSSGTSHHSSPPSASSRGIPQGTSSKQSSSNAPSLTPQASSNLLPSATAAAAAASSPPTAAVQRTSTW